MIGSRLGSCSLRWDRSTLLRPVHTVNARRDRAGSWRSRCGFSGPTLAAYPKAAYGRRQNGAAVACYLRLCSTDDPSVKGDLLCPSSQIGCHPLPIQLDGEGDTSWYKRLYHIASVETSPAGGNAMLFT